MDATPTQGEAARTAWVGVSAAGGAEKPGTFALQELPEGRPGPPASSARRRGRRPRPPKLYRIGEVVAYSGLSRQSVHNYTTMGLLHEARWTEGGHRLYDESVFERLDEIAEMKAQGRSLREIRKHFARIDAAGA